MKITGLITEYNPFHNGHLYHIEKSKEITGADAVIVVMSGNFVQRGTPAVMPKHLRANSALCCGAALVLELPVCYATGSAEFFAYGAVSLLDKLGCVDSICFGSECGDLALLEKLAEIISTEPEEYKQFLSKYLKEGNSFPLARQKALRNYCRNEAVDAVLSEPNNILGMEYLKALQRLGSSIKPFTISRISSHYHDESLQDSFSSASAIRKRIADTGLDSLLGQIPPAALSLLYRYHQKSFPIDSNDFSLLLRYKLLTEDRLSLLTYADVSEELANRICNRLNDYKTFEQFCALLKTKEVTYSRISRALIHILLDIKKNDYREIEYARLLGFCKKEVFILSLIKEHAKIPLLSKLSGSLTLSAAASHMLEQDIFAANLYEAVASDKFKTSFVHEYTQKIVIH